MFFSFSLSLFASSVSLCFFCLSFWASRRNAFFCPLEFSPGHMICFGKRKKIVSRKKICPYVLYLCQEGKPQTEDLVWILSNVHFLLPLCQPPVYSGWPIWLGARAKMTVATWSSQPIQNGHVEWATEISASLVNNRIIAYFLLAW